MIKNFLTLVVLLSLLPVQAEIKPEQQRLITVTGSSSLRATPDKVSIRFAIENLDKNAKKARAENDKVSSVVLNSLRKAGIAQQKIKVESFNINEKFEYNSKIRQRESLGYQAIREVKVEIYGEGLGKEKSLSDKTSAIVKLITQGGSNRINEVKFGLADDSEIKQKALKQAVSDARDKATVMLEAVNAKLGKIQSISEMNLANKPIYQRKLSMLMAADVESSGSEQSSYSEGELDIRASVSTVFEIE